MNDSIGHMMLQRFCRPGASSGRFRQFSLRIRQSVGAKRPQSRSIESPGRVKWVNHMDENDLGTECAGKKLGEIKRANGTSRKINWDQ
jgi:hypothetical protein